MRFAILANAVRSDDDRREPQRSVANFQVRATLEHPRAAVAPVLTTGIDDIAARRKRVAMPITATGDRGDGRRD
ncbi:hypothetical protein AWC17_15040 [Mycobacterium nebraskense]|uniref:Uncharacterized protein n=1 Tax=Mycobacterium nebraskense TaxID=244292 RepID=A0A1X1YYC2_9MYCO|nr:hypothetical protein AWC17_15040 [Mycobacterium nebraskense]